MHRVLPGLVATLASAAGLLAQFHTIDLGCGTPAPVLLPTVGTRLDHGLPYSLTAWNAPVGNPGFLAFGFVDTGGTPLGAYGMPGCLLHPDPLVSVLMVSAGSTAEGTLTMPVMPGGLTLFAQAALVAPGANAAGVVLSSAGRIAIDPWMSADEHVTTSSNRFGNLTVLDLPELNGVSDAVFMARRLDSNPTDIGVWFDPARDRWTIFNEDMSPMPTSERFVVVQPNSRAQAFQWRAVPSNTFANYVRFRHPALDGKPAARVHVTKLYLSGSGLAGYHTAPIGVWYDGSYWNVFNQDGSAMPSAAAFMVLVDDEDLESIASMTVASPGGSEVRLASRSHEYSQNAVAYPIVTQNWNPAGNPGVYNNHRVFAWFSWIPLFQVGDWRIVNDGSAPIPAGASFNVFTVDWLRRSEWLQAMLGSSPFPQHSLRFYSPAVPASWFLSTLVWNPGGVPVGVYNDHESYVAYDQNVGNGSYWGLWNSDASVLPMGLAYNFLHVNRGADGLLAEATAANSSGSDLTIDFPPLNGNPGAVAFLQAANVFATSLNDHPTGLVYSTSQGRWLVRNLDGAAMPAGAQFVVVVANANLSPNCQWFTHTVTAGNLGSTPSLTHISHPLLDGNPNAKCVVTRVVGNGGATSRYPIGVYYSSVTQAWAIHHQALSHQMPIGARFHVLVEAP
ncbi:MAG: hypothetical protein KDE27_00980 [Planctomycetes bacterium]|nr:hypothetical protein [Planctomycetota bacterium]